jgi:hypothetical protein
MEGDRGRRRARARRVSFRSCREIWLLCLALRRSLASLPSRVDGGREVGSGSSWSRARAGAVGSGAGIRAPARGLVPIGRARPSRMWLAHAESRVRDLLLRDQAVAWSWARIGSGCSCRCACVREGWHCVRVRLSCGVRCRGRGVRPCAASVRVRVVACVVAVSSARRRDVPRPRPRPSVRGACVLVSALAGAVSVRAARGEGSCGSAVAVVPGRWLATAPPEARLVVETRGASASLCHYTVCHGLSPARARVGSGTRVRMPRAPVRLFSSGAEDGG